MSKDENKKANSYDDWNIPVAFICNKSSNVIGYMAMNGKNSIVSSTRINRDDSYYYNGSTVQTMAIKNGFPTDPVTTLMMSVESLWTGKRYYGGNMNDLIKIVYDSNLLYIPKQNISLFAKAANVKVILKTSSSYKFYHNGNNAPYTNKPENPIELCECFGKIRNEFIKNRAASDHQTEPTYAEVIAWAKEYYHYVETMQYPVITAVYSVLYRFNDDSSSNNKKGSLYIPIFEGAQISVVTDKNSTNEDVYKKLRAAITDKTKIEKAIIENNSLATIIRDKSLATYQSTDDLASMIGCEFDSVYCNDQLLGKKGRY
jgi:hypothetical protein